MPILSAAQPGHPLLEVNDLRVGFVNDAGEFPAVRGISFAIQPQQVVGLVGESGSGKSVTALSLLGLLGPAQGAVVSGQALWRGPDQTSGVDLLQLSEAQLRQYRGRHLSMIFQEPMSSLNPVYTCGWQIMESLRLHQGLRGAAARTVALEWFDRVRLADPLRMFKAYPHQLSGGQQQRVMIAMALCTQPALLIADEPTTALDVTIQATILELLRELQAATQASILFISHDLGVIRSLCDQVLVMQQGLVVEQGPIDAVFNQPTQPYTRGLLACRPPLSRRLHRLPVISDFVEANPPSAALPDTSFWTPYLPDPATETTRRQRLHEAEPLLEVHNLSVWFDRPRRWPWQSTAPVRAVDGVSLQVRPGETLGIVGESGSGKTTLGRALVRLVDPRAGHIVFAGQDILALDQREFAHLRPQIQLVFQDPYSSLNPRMPVGKAILEGLHAHRLGQSQAQRRDEVMALLQRVGLQPQHYHRYPASFSGGQRQRLGIARALALQPRVLICDESVAALDVSVQAQVLNLLKDLQEEYGFAMLFISHDLSVINFVADQVVVMQHGKIVEAGPPEAILQHPTQAYTRELIAAIL